MGKKDKINTLVLIIFIIALVGIALYMYNGNQQSTQIKIMNNGSIEENGTLNVKLSLLNDTGIENKKINIVILDKNNKEVLKKTVITNSMGESSVNLNNVFKGEYTVNIIFEGDENYLPNTASQEIKIIDKKVAETTSESTQSTESTQVNEANTNDYGLQHDVDEWEYTGGEGNAEYYTTGSGDRLVLYDDGVYEYYDGQGHVVGGQV